MKRGCVIPIIGIYAGLDEEMSYLLEEELISKFGRKDLNKGSLLNLTDGGEGAYGTSYKITPEHRENITASIRGLHKSAEHRKKIGLAGRGRIPPNKGQVGQQTAWNKDKKTGPRSEEEKRQISSTLLGVMHEKVSCSVCGKLVGIRSVNRYHNNNCKLLTV